MKMLNSSWFSFCSFSFSLSSSLFSFSPLSIFAKAVCSLQIVPMTDLPLQDRSLLIGLHLDELWLQLQLPLVERAVLTGKTGRGTAVSMGTIVEERVAETEKVLSEKPVVSETVSENVAPAGKNLYQTVLAEKPLSEKAA